MSPFARWFQAQILRKAEGVAELALEVREEFFQGQGIVHGGILAALLDSAMGSAVESAFGRVVTVELSVHYLRPVCSGTLKARGKVVHGGRKLVHAQGEAFWGEERVAWSKGIFYRVG